MKIYYATNRTSSEKRKYREERKLLCSKLYNVLCLPMDVKFDNERKNTDNTDEIPKRSYVATIIDKVRYRDIREVLEVGVSIETYRGK